MGKKSMLRSAACSSAQRRDVRASSCHSQKTESQSGRTIWRGWRITSPLYRGAQLDRHVEDAVAFGRPEGEVVEIIAALLADVLGEA
jgi:hypothetical protein